MLARTLYFTSVAAIVVALASCTLGSTGSTSRDPSPASLEYAYVGPDAPPTLVVNGKEITPVEFLWLPDFEAQIGNMVTSMEHIPIVTRKNPAFLELRFYRIAPPPSTLVRQCEQIYKKESVNPNKCTYQEFGINLQEDWQVRDSFIELRLPITMKSKYVTLSIFYPNANGWDKASTDSPMNHANYVFILKSD